MSYSAIRSATASARSTVSNAYCASTISVISGPAAARTSRATSTTQSSGPDRPLCAYGPENVASSLAAVNPRSRARVAQPTIDSTYASKDDTSGCRDAYGVSVWPRASPHSCQHGTPSALPRRSHSAMSIAPIACTSAPRRPVMQVPTYSSCQIASTSAGSRPISSGRSPRSIVCVPGASMQARAIHALRSVSPIPVRPSSVSISTTIVSWAELVAPTS